MKEKQYVGVLLVAALLGAGLGGAAIGVVPRLTKASTPAEQARITITSTVKPTLATAALPSTTAAPAAKTAVTTAAATTTPAASAATAVTATSSGLSVASVSGTVQSVKGSQITVKNDAGAIINLVLGTGVNVQKTGKASLADVTVGNTLVVTGSQDSGTITASGITITAASGTTQVVPTMTGAQPTFVPGGTFTQAVPTGTGGPPANLPGATSTRNQPAATGTQFPSGQGQQPGAQGTTGTVQSIDGNTITITRGNTSFKVLVSSSTTFQKTSQGSTADIVAGCSLTASGSQQSDGSIQAVNITINLG